MLTTRSILSTTMLCLGLLLIMTGCAPNIKNIATDYRGSNDNGVVILSFTASGDCGYAYFIDVRSIDGRIEHTIGMQEAFEQRDWKRTDGDDCSLDATNYIGRLSVVELPPGDYVIHKIYGTSRYRSFESVDNFSLRFSVTKNAISYIGNAHFFVHDDEYSFETQNQQSRDIELFQRKYPALKDREIILDLLEEIHFQSV